MIKRIILAYLTLGSLSGCLMSHESQLQNSFAALLSSDPVHFEREFFKTENKTFERRLSELPQEGALPTAWSDTFLPNRWGGGAVRWYKDTKLGDMDLPTSRPDMWTYKLNSLNELKKLSLESLKLLSPAEKFDILMGRYEYPLTNVERKRTDSNHQIWEGTCNGWSTAALKFSEPPPVSITNKDGIVVAFGSSDIKSLLMLHQYFIERYKNYAILGERCENVATPKMELYFPKMLSEDSVDACSDSNAGAFHLVLTNMIGRLKKGLVFDVDRDSEVWNQPVYRYSSRVIQRTPTSALINTRVWYAEEEMPNWEPLTINKKNAEVMATYNYEVELNSKGEIIGGKWKDGQAVDYKMHRTYHPDFIWFADGEETNYKLDTFTDKFKNKYRITMPIDFGAIVELWELSVGKKFNFRGMDRIPANL